ncbi:energy transducer TonB [Olivibacter domesticus]|uniref:Protein TonB n=1 Tax=Olivibacter domesticus TaxID=407022 RepID=A0A1H7HSY8_OLID1|nr:energy transducer TonB [Olivibacter domesticus]SEK53401.1 protein TonB [Olivibacter domesticus]
MLNPKLNIVSTVWLDLIFDGRNKSYGAYVLRKNAHGDLTKALFMGVIFFIAMILIPIIAQKYQEEIFSETTVDNTTVLLKDIPLHKKEEPMVLPVKTYVKSHEDKIKMVPPKVVSHLLATEEPPSVKDLVNASPGPENIVGDPSVPISIDLPLGKTDQLETITEGKGAADIFVAVEVAPSFPGGMRAFLNYVADNYQFPPAAKEQGVNGKVILNFIVEKDGTLSNIKVVRDLGFGTGLEAVRILEKSPIWKPGIQNGRPVRVSYSLPINLQIK